MGLILPLDYKLEQAFDEVRFSGVGAGDDYLIHSISFEKKIAQ